jgi:hypothetical protein
VGLGTEVKPEVAADGGRLTHVKAVKGTLHTTTKLRETKSYTVKNHNPQGRAVLIEHPVRPEFKLVDTTNLVQTARDAYRFELKARQPAALRRLAGRGGWLLWVDLATPLPPWDVPEEFQAPCFEEAPPDEDMQSEDHCQPPNPPAGRLRSLRTHFDRHGVAVSFDTNCR